MGRVLTFSYWDGLKKDVEQAMELEEVAADKKLHRKLAAVLKTIIRVSEVHNKETNDRQALLR